MESAIVRGPFGLSGVWQEPCPGLLHRSQGLLVTRDRAHAAQSSPSESIWAVFCAHLHLNG